MHSVHVMYKEKTETIVASFSQQKQSGEESQTVCLFGITQMWDLVKKKPLINKSAICFYDLHLWQDNLKCTLLPKWQIQCYLL